MRTLCARMSGGLMAAALMMGLMISTPARAETSFLAPGTEVPLEFMQEVNSKHAQQGDVVELRVFDDVVENGRVVIPRGERAEGVVETVHRGRTFGRRGELKIRLTRVHDRGGDWVPMEPYKTGNRWNGTSVAAESAGLLVLGPIGLVAGPFIHGPDVKIHAGTHIVGFVR